VLSRQPPAGELAVLPAAFPSVLSIPYSIERIIPQFERALDAE
jgi:hypothetical protein